MLILFLLNRVPFKSGICFPEKSSVMQKLKAPPLNPQFVNTMDFLTKANAGLPAGYKKNSPKESRKFELALIFRWK